MTNKKRKRLLIGCVGSLCVALFLSLFLVDIDRLLKQLTPNKDTFTELYFEDHLHLPRNISLGTPFRFLFTVHNKEQKPMNYTIKIFSQNDVENPQLIELSTMQVNLDPEQKRSFSTDIVLSEYTTPRQKVEVKLLELNQSIHFWVMLATPTAAPKTRR